MKLKNKKKFIIAFLSFSSLSIIYPINYINNDKETNIDDSLVKNIEPLNSEKESIISSNYNTLFANKYTQPIISYNSENPGFLGVDSLKERIYWTGTSFFNQWSSKLSEHPIAKSNTNIKFPILVSAIHSDAWDDGVNNKNLIFAVVANKFTIDTQKLYYVFVYDAFTGSPIMPTDDSTNAIQLKGLKNSTILSDGSVMTLSYDQNNDRILYYYLDTISKVKGDFGFFSFDSNTKKITTSIFEPLWNSIDTSIILNNNNIIMSFSGFKKGFREIGIVALVYDSLTGWILPVMFDENLELMTENNKNTKALMPDSKVIDIGKSNDPKLFQEFYTPQLMIEYDGLSPEIIFRIRTLVHSGTNKYYADNMQVSLFSICFDYVIQSGIKNLMAKQNSIGLSQWYWMYKNNLNMNIWYDRSSGHGSALNLSRITYISKSLPNRSTYEVREINFTKILYLEDDIGLSSVIGTFNIDMSTNFYDSSYAILLNSEPSKPRDNIYLWSSSVIGRDNEIFSRDYGTYSKFQNGSINLSKPQEYTDKKGMTNSISPYNVEEVVDSMIKEISTYPNSEEWNTMFNYNKIPGFSAKITSANINRNPQEGTIYGTVNIKGSLTSKESVQLTSKVSFFIQGFKQKIVATTLQKYGDGYNILASDLTKNNAKDIFQFISIPNSFNDNKWTFSEINNLVGTVTVNVSVINYYDDNLEVVNTTGNISIEATGFQTIEPTNFKQSSIETINVNTFDINNENISNYILGVGIVPGVTIKYNKKSENSLVGTIIVDIIVNKYYDSLGMISMASKTQELTLHGFSKTNKTTLSILDPLTSPDAYEVQVGAITEEILINKFLIIANKVPNSKVILEITKRDIKTGIINARVTIDRVYDENGLPSNQIIESLEFTSFAIGEAPKGTSIYEVPNTDKLFFPEEINDTIIQNYVGLLNPVTNSISTYKINSKNNLTGTIDISIQVTGYKDTNGIIVNNQKTFSISIKGFESVKYKTTFVSISSFKEYFAQYHQDPLEYIKIINGSKIPLKFTNIDVEKITFDNLKGELTLLFTTKNYFDTIGNFVSLPKKESLTISGFMKVPGPTRLSKKSSILFGDISPSDFNININNWSDNFNLQNVYSIVNSSIKTELTKVNKKSWNNKTGEVELELNFKNGFFNSSGVIVENTSISTNFVIRGFKNTIVPITKDDNLFVIIGVSVTGVLFFIILITIIILIKNKKKHIKLIQKLNISSKIYNKEGNTSSNLKSGMIPPSNLKPGMIPPPNLKPGMIPPPKPKPGMIPPPKPKPGMIPPKR